MTERAVLCSQGFGCKYYLSVAKVEIFSQTLA